VIILDTSAIAALVTGHKTLTTLAVNMSRSGDQLIVPALCLMQAEAADTGAAHRVLGYPCAVVDPVGQIDAPAIGSMIRDGYGGPDTCHALYAALRRTDTSGMPILLTDAEDRYPPGTLAIGIDSPGMRGFH